jgi:hypothetical protein
VRPIRLQPELIPARERRRAPTFVKMAVAVMDQACRMADIDRASVATVFASGMGDMQVTDYMCRTLATNASALSPTKFHNSVHNASTGYWSIATGSNAPSSAVSGYDRSGAMSLLEGAIQSVEEDLPVLIAVQEMAPPKPFRSVYQGQTPLAAALLLMGEERAVAPLGTLALSVDYGASAASEPVPLPGFDLAGNFAADVAQLLLAVASGEDRDLTMPVSNSAVLSLGYQAARSQRRAHG